MILIRSEVSKYYYQTIKKGERNMQVKSNEFYSNPNQKFNSEEQQGKVNPKELLSFLIKEAITDSQVGVVVFHNEENRLHSMDLTVDKKMETICFPKNADELARILEMYGKGNNND